MSPDESDERSQGNPFVTVGASVLDVVDPLLFLAGLATHAAFIVDRSGYEVVLWLSVALLCASSFSYFVCAFVYPSTFLHPRLEAVLLRLYGIPRIVLLLVLSPLLPVLTWLHWKLFERKLYAPHPLAAVDAQETLPQVLHDFDATDDRADSVRRIVHSAAMLTCVPRRLLLLDAAHALPRCAVQFATISFTSESPAQYVAVVVSMLTVLSKAYAICGRSTQVSTFVFKVALVTFDLFALFYIMSVHWYELSDRANVALFATFLGTLGVPLLLLLFEVFSPVQSLLCFSDVTWKLFLPWDVKLTCSSPWTFLQLLVGYPLWWVTYVSILPTLLMLLLGVKLSWAFLHKPMLNTEAVEARRLLFNFVTQPDRNGVPEVEERVLHLFKWFRSNRTQYTPTPELLESLATRRVGSWPGCRCLSDCNGRMVGVGLLVGPAVLFGIAHPFAAFVIHEGPHSVTSLTLFSCMLAALGVAVALTPRMLVVASVNGMMEPAFRKEVLKQTSHGRGRSRAVKEHQTVTWTLADARQCVKAYFNVSMAVALPLIIETRVLPVEVIMNGIAPYLDAAVATSLKLD